VRTELSDKLGITHPIFAFTPSEHVAAAVSRAGGLGVLGCLRFNDAEELDSVLSWMDDNTDGKPYGVDIVMPAKVPTEGTATDLSQYIPDDHKAFVQESLRKLGVPPLPADDDPGREGVLGWLHSVARAHVDTALKHRPALIANALGSPPKDVIDQAHEHGIPVAALAGKAKHAISHLDNGVDIIIAQGTEAGGHTGEIATMVLVPEVVKAVSPTPVLAAGGIGSGAQIAASLALGAQGVWMGSLWLATAESNSSPEGLEAYMDATSSDTVRSRSYTGKPARMLRNAWTDAWEDPSGPGPLGMPLQNILTAEANARISRAHRKDLVFAPIGQIVGSMNEVKPVRDVMFRLVEEYIEATERLSASLDTVQS